MHLLWLYIYTIYGDITINNTFMHISQPLLRLIPALFTKMSTGAPNTEKIIIILAVFDMFENCKKYQKCINMQVLSSFGLESQIIYITSKTGAFFKSSKILANTFGLLLDGRDFKKVPIGSRY